MIPDLEIENKYDGVTFSDQVLPIDRYNIFFDCPVVTIA